MNTILGPDGRAATIHQALLCTSWIWKQSVEMLKREAGEARVRALRESVNETTDERRWSGAVIGSTIHVRKPWPYL